MASPGPSDLAVGGGGGGGGGGGRARNPKVRELGTERVTNDEDVAGLDVTMDDAGAMHALESIEQIAAQPDHVVPSKGSALEPLFERRSVNELHDVVMESRLAVRVVDRDHVGVLDARHQPRFAREGVGGVRSGELGPQQFERDGAVEREVGGEEHPSHAAAAELALEAVGRGYCIL